MCTPAVEAAQIAKQEWKAIKGGRQIQFGQCKSRESVEKAKSAYVADATVWADGVDDVHCVGHANGADATAENGSDGASNGDVENGVEYTHGADDVKRLDRADWGNRAHDAEGADATCVAPGTNGMGVFGVAVIEVYGLRGYFKPLLRWR